jgi:hypothetical protein
MHWQWSSGGVPACVTSWTWSTERTGWLLGHGVRCVVAYGYYGVIWNWREFGKLSLYSGREKKVLFPLCNCSLKQNKLCHSVFYYEVLGNCLRKNLNKKAFQKVCCPPPEDQRSGRITLVIARTTITQPLPTIQHQWTTTQVTPTVTTSTSIERIYPKTAIE